METLSLGLPFMAAFLDPGAWGREFTRKMETVPEHGRHVDRRRGHAARDATGSRCTPTEKDKFGLPIPNVHFDDHPNDIAMRSHAFRQGTAVYEAAGATRGLRDAALSLDAQSRHQPDERERRATAWSTSGARPTTSKNLFVSDGSQFTTGAAENPTLTIVTLAIRQAEYIAEQMGKGEI